MAKEEVFPLKDKEEFCDTAHINLNMCSAQAVLTRRSPARGCYWGRCRFASPLECSGAPPPGGHALSPAVEHSQTAAVLGSHAFMLHQRGVHLQHSEQRSRRHVQGKSSRWRLDSPSRPGPPDLKQVWPSRGGPARHTSKPSCANSGSLWAHVMNLHWRGTCLHIGHGQTVLLILHLLDRVQEEHLCESGCSSALWFLSLQQLFSDYPWQLPK